MNLRRLLGTSVAITAIGISGAGLTACGSDTEEIQSAPVAQAMCAVPAPTPEDPDAVMRLDDSECNTGNHYYGDGDNDLLATAAFWYFMSANTSYPSIGSPYYGSGSYYAPRNTTTIILGGIPAKAGTIPSAGFSSGKKQTGKTVTSLVSSQSASASASKKPTATASAPSATATKSATAVPTGTATSSPSKSSTASTSPKASTATTSAKPSTSATKSTPKSSATTSKSTPKATKSTPKATKSTPKATTQKKSTSGYGSSSSKKSTTTKKK